MSYRLQQSLSERPCVTRNAPSKRSEPTPPFSFSTTIHRYAEIDCVSEHRRRRVTMHLEGVRYYGYRYYNPDLGRWINRDPLLERYGRRLYLFIFNRPIDMVDVLGLRGRPPDNYPGIPGRQIGLPATKSKCRWLKRHMNLIARGSGSVNWRLWRAWLKGTGSPDLDFGDFDTSGCISGILKRARDDYKDDTLANVPNLSCGQRWRYGGNRYYGQCTSGNEMISGYEIELKVEIGGYKKCDDAGCCEKLIARMWWTATATDETDFDDGKWFNGGMGISISDALVNKCNSKYWKTGKDFDIEASTEGDEVWSVPCSGK